MTTPTVDPPTVTDLCCQPTLRLVGSTPLRIPARPAWITCLWRAVDSTGDTVTLMAALLLAYTLIGAGYL